MGKSEKGQPRGQNPPLEAERGLQLDFAVGRRTGEGASGQSDRTPEIGSAQVANRRSQVLAIEDVTSIHAEGQVVAPPGARRTKDRADAGAGTVAETASTRSTAAMTAASGAARRCVRIGGAGFPAETECLAQAQVQHEL